jgi:hypothetical protein
MFDFSLTWDDGVVVGGIARLGWPGAPCPR